MDIEGKYHLVNGDALEFLRSLEPGSVDLLLSDPPYGTTDNEWDVAPDWNEYWPAIWRALKPNGAAIIFSQLPPALDVVAASRKEYRYEFIWHKTNAVGFLNSGKMPMRAHENALVFYRKLPTYNSIRIASQDGEYTINQGKLTKNYSNNGLTKNVTDVIRCGRTGKSYHPTQKPTEILEYLVRLYTKPGELVVDMFMGSGSTAVAALGEHRRFAGSELSPEYFEICKTRLREEVMNRLPLTFED